MRGKMQRLVTNLLPLPARYRERSSNQALRFGTPTNAQDADTRWLHYKVFAVPRQAFFLAFGTYEQQEVRND